MNVYTTNRLKNNLSVVSVQSVFEIKKLEDNS